jgi:hypothetical protein
MMKITGIILMELKYCEQCGGIWLRCQGSEEDLCQRCRCAVARYTGACRRALKNNNPPRRARSWFEARWMTGKSCRTVRGVGARRVQ